MNYWVIMNEQQTMIIDNVNHVSTYEGMVRFCDEEAQLIAAFQLKDIVGFMRMNEPNIEMPEYKLDFGKIRCKEGPEHHVIDQYQILKDEVRKDYEMRDISFLEIQDSMNEVGREAIERGGLVVKGGTLPLLARNVLKERLNKATCEREIKKIEKMLSRNMEECLGI